MKLNLNFVRSQFPAFSEPSLEGWAHFENAGGSYPCRQVIDRLTDFYLKNKVQVGYAFPASQKAYNLMEESYQKLAAYMNVKPEEIHLGPSTTQNVYVLAQAMRPMWKENDEIIVSCQDHEANAGAWRRLAKTGIKVIEWHVDPKTGLLSLDNLKSLINEKTKMIAYPHCSNVIGHINPVKEISRMAREKNILTVVDGVGTAPHGFPDLKELDTDIYLFSTYKTYGPHLGVMYVDENLILKMENQSHYFHEGMTRKMLVPAGPDHAQVASAAGMVEYFDAVYEHHFDEKVQPAERNRKLHSLFENHEKSLMEPLLEFLRSRNDVKIVGPESTEDRCPIIAILPLKKTIQDVYEKLTAQKLMLSTGFYYAARPLIDMNLPLDPGVIRISFVHYTSPEEIEQLIEGLKVGLD